MNRLLFSQEEAMKIAEQGNLYIPPHKFEQISRSAAQVVSMLSKPQVHCTYQEIMLVLDTAKAILKRGYTQSAQDGLDYSDD